MVKQDASALCRTYHPAVLLCNASHLVSQLFLDNRIRLKSSYARSTGVRILMRDIFCIYGWLITLIFCNGATLGL